MRKRKSDSARGLVGHSFNKLREEEGRRNVMKWGLESITASLHKGWGRLKAQKRRERATDESGKTNPHSKLGYLG